ncbi:CHASE domain-containing protein [Noviherbaspirillum sp. ST9]|uniref:CHASE domain-containing protein n=1 Tax=Noviherbaspirillum sp. ST9 TaxID=3401606 RepID=UPI003B589360
MTSPETGRGKHGRRPRMLLNKLLPWMVLALSLAVTADLWRNQQRNAERVLQNDFDFHVHEALGLIEERIGDYENILRGTAVLFYASKDVDGDEFNAYVQRLELARTHPGIREMVFVSAVPRADKKPFLARMRKEVRSGFTITPETDHPLLAPVTYRVPLEGEPENTTGLDLLSIPSHQAALEHASEYRSIAISTAFPLPASPSRPQGMGVAMYVPVYRFDPVENRDVHLGWIGAPIRVDSLMSAVTTEIGVELDVEIRDGALISASANMRDKNGWPMQIDKGEGRYRTRTRMQVANREWEVTVQSLPAFEARLDRSGAVQAWFGAGVSILLMIITWQLAGSRDRALKAAREMNQELIERERRYRQMFEDSASIAFLLDPSNGRIVDANVAAAAFWGYPVTALRRMTIDEIDTAPQDGIHALMQQVTAGTVSRFECRHKLASGDMREVELYAGTLDYKQRVLIYAILHDITGRKQAELALRSSEERFRLIAENTGDVIWMMDADTLNFTYISPSIQRQRGYTAEEIVALHSHVGRRPQPAATGAMPKMGHRLHERIRRFMNGDESQRREIKEIDQQHKDGRMIPVEIESTLLCDADNIPRSLIGVSRDISARRQAQEEQKRFVAMVSHEFRTPLATIDGAVQRLLSTSGHADDATRKRLVKIEKSVDRLTALLDDYLTQERFDTAGQGLHLSQASPRSMLQDCADSARALTADHIITVDATELPDTITCDADRLRLTLRILADNAVKYTPPDTRITLMGRNAPQGGIELQVADNGRGIDDEELPHIFDKFFRGRSAAREAGSGLGLHLARAVVEMHGGTLVARNRVEGGAQFTLWLPAQVERTSIGPVRIG